MVYPERAVVHIGMNRGANWQLPRLISAMPLWCRTGNLEVASPWPHKYFSLVLLVEIRLSPFRHTRSVASMARPNFPGSLPTATVNF